MERKKKEGEKANPEYVTALTTAIGHLHAPSPEPSGAP